MKRNPTISVLMPARNAEQYIRPAIDSVLEQDFEDWELIVVDDFSADDTSRIMTDYGDDARIKCLLNPGRPGIIPALEEAFRQSKGSFITRMDADDLMPPGKLRTLLEIAEKNPKTLATGKVRYFSDQPVSEGYRRYEAWLNGLADKGNFYCGIYRECIIASPNWMVSRACFEQDFEFADLRYPEDYDMVFRWYKAGYKIEVSNSITHLWREHTERTSRTSAHYQQEAFFDLKTTWFIALELKPGEKVQLLGAGKKGKLVAKKLIDKKVDFDWFDFNAVPDQMVLSKKIRPVSQIQTSLKAILTAWPVDAKTQQKILAFMTEHHFEAGKNYWLF